MTLLLGAIALAILLYILRVGHTSLVERKVRRRRLEMMSTHRMDHLHGWFVGPGSGLQYQVFMLDGRSGLWHQAKRLYSDGAYCECLWRIPIEHSRATTYASSWDDLRWKHVGTKLRFCPRCYNGGIRG